MSKISRILMMLTLMVSFFSFSAVSFAGEVDALVDKLVEKGILTRSEANLIVMEAKQESRKDIAKGTQSHLPEWVQNMKLKGDLRLRYQWEDKSSATSSEEDRHRGRVRFRLGIESKVNDKLKVAAGLATGGSDSRSTNQSFDGTFSTKSIQLDYAYAEWAANEWMVLRGGKVKGIKKEIFRPSDLLWDSDIHPEGLTINLVNNMDGLEFFMNTAFWVLEEDSGDTSDPFMVVIQPGVKTKLSDKVTLEAAVAGYFPENVQGSTLTGSAGTNSGSATGLTYEYKAIAPSLKLSFKEPFGESFIKSMKLYGDYIHNPDPSDKNTGWLTGIGFKVGRAMQIFGKDWELGYLYRYLEKDAWLDTFPDSDALGGKTDVEGHEIKMAYPLSENTELGLDYYLVKRIDASDENRRHIVQVDWKMKF